MSIEGQTIREAHAGAMNALGADVHPYSASAIRDHEKVMGEAIAALEARLAAAERKPFRADPVLWRNRALEAERALRAIERDPLDHAFHAPEKVRRYKAIARAALPSESRTPTTKGTQ